MRKRTFKYAYQVMGFPVKKPFHASFWSSFTICESKLLAELEIKHLIKTKQLQKADKKSPWNDPCYERIVVRVK